MAERRDQVSSPFTPQPSGKHPPLLGAHMQTVCVLLLASVVTPRSSIPGRNLIAAQPLTSLLNACLRSPVKPPATGVATVGMGSLKRAMLNRSAWMVPSLQRHGYDSEDERVTKYVSTVQIMHLLQLFFMVCPHHSHHLHNQGHNCFIE